MITDALEIMKFLTCPSCLTKSINTYLLEKEKEKHEHRSFITSMNLQQVYSTNIRLYLTCSNCQFQIKITNKDWLRIFHKHAFNI